MLEGFWIRNFKSLKQVGIGTAFPQFVYIEDPASVLPFDLGTTTLLTGLNGSGKSSVLDAFSFVSDCYRYGVDYACGKRGGYDAIYSHDGKGVMSFGFHYRQPEESVAATYAISIGYVRNKAPYIDSELIAYRNGKESFPIAFLQNGQKTIRYLAADERISGSELTSIEFTDLKHLGLSALGSHPKYPVWFSLRNLFENWSTDNFYTDTVHGLDSTQFKPHENPRGYKLSQFIRYLVEQLGDEAESVINSIAAGIPNVLSVLLDNTNRENPLLSFVMDGISIPIPITHLSEATIRLFSYVLRLEEPTPAPLITFDNPENGLDRLHRWYLTELLRKFDLSTHGSQLLFTTQSAELTDTAHPQNVWIFSRDQAGFTVVERAADLIPPPENPNEPKNLEHNWFSSMFEDRI
ncbi:MAG: ATP-binding protein [Planctomycetaceae bacterium]|jgi:predicted ATPase|nr:ATP-binding protein [Planctomycetaceae bacterium]